MADLSNLKISNTFSRLLQLDPDTTQLQDGVGSNPSTITFNGTTLKYVDGNQQNNYILTSDANGIARWAVNSGGGGSTDVYWSANTDGSITPSGLTTNIGLGTTTPNKTLTVVGDISGTTDLYLGSSTHTGSTITAPNKLTLKGNSSTNDYLTLEDDFIHMYIDGSSAIVAQNSPNDGVIILNSSSKNMDTKIKVDDGFSAIHVDASTNVVRVRDHLIVTNPLSSDIVLPLNYNYGLYVSGSSIFYSGGSNISTNAIESFGDISGTTSLKIGDGNGFISAATINSPSISATTLHGTIDGGTF